MEKLKFKGKNIKAILFDSGRVLNEPVTGQWFMPPNFFAFVDPEKFRAIDDIALHRAYQTAQTYLSQQYWITTEEEEYAHFAEFYRLFADALPELGLTPDSIASITHDLVYNYKKYRFYSDVIEGLPELSKTYRLAVVSDAWPSLESVFKHAGLRDYFSSFVISSVIGVSKPHERMYLTALEELELSPEEAVFVDDNVRNCDGAARLGIAGIVLCRDLEQYRQTVSLNMEYPVVRDMNEVLEILKLGTGG
ncbi:HAD-IA family hydrolase [Paenibacillus sanfengchensis]|uniref:HAD family hydrolase n=1 Tax=Paenibacillus sanfengchensis TaxID=3119819 RepID=UPI002FE3EA68